MPLTANLALESVQVVMNQLQPPVSAVGLTHILIQLIISATHANSLAHPVLLQVLALHVFRDMSSSLQLINVLLRAVSTTHLPTAPTKKHLAPTLPQQLVPSVFRDMLQLLVDVSLVLKAALFVIQMTLLLAQCVCLVSLSTLIQYV